VRCAHDEIYAGLSCAQHTLRRCSICPVFCEALRNRVFHSHNIPPNQKIKRHDMKQIQQSLRTGVTEVADIPCPQAGAGQLLIRSRATLVSAGTERMLDELLEVARVTIEVAAGGG
jgi:hypothetical protein